MAKLIILSGPSCVGKGPLVRALSKVYPELTAVWGRLVLFNSRSPRPGESDGVDYHFRDRSVIEDFRHNSEYLVADVRGDLQAIDMSGLRNQLQTTDVFFEGNPIIIEKLLSHSAFDDIQKRTFFLSPLSRDEIEFLKTQSQQTDLQSLVTDVMRCKLLRRTKKQKTNLSLKDLENIERRAGSALREMKYGWQFDVVIPNHDGEDSEHWDAFYWPLADARKALECFAALLQGQSHPLAEKWNQQLLA